MYTKMVVNDTSFDIHIDMLFQQCLQHICTKSTKMLCDDLVLRRESDTLGKWSVNMEKMGLLEILAAGTVIESHLKWTLQSSDHV